MNYFQRITNCLCHHGSNSLNVVLYYLSYFLNLIVGYGNNTTLSCFDCEEEFEERWDPYTDCQVYPHNTPLRPCLDIEMYCMVSYNVGYIINIVILQESLMNSEILLATITKSFGYWNVIRSPIGSAGIFPSTTFKTTISIVDVFIVRTEAEILIAILSYILPVFICRPW